VRGLSCYTANLHRYLAAESDASALVAGSVRLAVRVDSARGLLAFSHHEPSLDRLPDGSRLRYAGAPTPAEALAAVAGELAEHGRALVVVDSSRLPWSVTRAGPPTPHWLLVDGRRAGGWHVVDGFAALLPAGEQRPHHGWSSEGCLREAMTLPGHWAPEHELRIAMAFGSPVAVPPGTALWLSRAPGGPSPASGEGPLAQGRWLRGDAEVLPFLASHLVERGAAASVHLDDLWAAAAHRSFSYRWHLAHGAGRPGLEAKLAHWERLPQLIRFAIESAGRGRPRPSLVRSALELVLAAGEPQG